MRMLFVCGCGPARISERLDGAPALVMRSRSAGVTIVAVPSVPLSSPPPPEQPATDSPTRAQKMGVRISLLLL